MRPSITHSPRTSQFQTTDAVLEYRLSAGVMSITHTEVAPRLRGQGVAAALMQAALAHARDHALKVRPLCSYASLYMQRHPDTRDLLA